MTHEAQMTDLREAVARAIYDANRDGSPVPWNDSFKRNYPAATDAHYKTADAVLLAARPAIIEECARVVVQNHVYGCAAVVHELRALAEKP